MKFFKNFYKKSSGSDSSHSQESTQPYSTQEPNNLKLTRENLRLHNQKYQTTYDLHAITSCNSSESSENEEIIKRTQQWVNKLPETPEISPKPSLFRKVVNHMCSIS